MRIKKLETDADNDNGVPIEMRNKLRIALNTGDDLRRQLVTAQEDLRALRHQLAVVLANDANDDTGTVHGGHLDEDEEKELLDENERLKQAMSKARLEVKRRDLQLADLAAEKEKVELHLQAIKAGGSRRRQAQSNPLFSPCDKRCEKLKEEAARLSRLNDDLQEQLEQYAETAEKAKAETVAAALKPVGGDPTSDDIGCSRCREFSDAELSRLKKGSIANLGALEVATTVRATKGM